MRARRSEGGSLRSGQWRIVSGRSIEGRCEKMEYHGHCILFMAESKANLYSCNSSSFQCMNNERKQSFLIVNMIRHVSCCVPEIDA